MMRRGRNAGLGERTLGLLQPVLGHGAVGDDGGPHAGAQRGDARAERRQHAAADDDVIGAVAEGDVDRDIGGMFQWRSHGVTLIPSVVGWAEGAPAHSRARRASIHSSTMRSCGTSREADRQVGGPVDRLARFEQTADGRDRILGLQQRPVGAALDALHDDVDIRLEPDRDRLVADAVAGLLAHEGAAAGGDHGRAAIEQPRDHPRLAVAEIRLAMGREDFRNGHTGMGRLDLDIGVEKRQAQPGRQPPADGGLAGAHHADQHDRTPSQSRRDVGLLGGARLCRCGGLGHQKLCGFAGLAPRCDSYTTPIDAVARDSCHGDGNMLDDFIG